MNALGQGGCTFLPLYGIIGWSSPEGAERRESPDASDGEQFGSRHPPVLPHHGGRRRLAQGSVSKHGRFDAQTDACAYAAVPVFTSVCSHAQPQPLSSCAPRLHVTRCHEMFLAEHVICWAQKPPNLICGKLWKMTIA